MNHTYRLVWNDASQRYTPAPETARGRGKTTRRSAVLMAAMALAGTGVQAGPSGGTVSAGSGTISQNGSTTTITQGSQNLAINWATFNVAAGESVSFVQPNASAIALNRVTGTGASSIDGSLSANGQVWILNPNGVLFGSTASVSVGGLVASTLSLSDADFLAGKRSFSGDGSQGSVVNQGSLTGGYVALLGKRVSNEGSIVTADGTAALAAGDKVTLDFSGTSLLSVQVDEGTLNALAQNKGLIRADNGTVILTATAKDALLDTVVNNEGVIEARGIDASGGTILLLGGFNGGTVRAGGTLDASASGAHDGGFIETSGAHVQVAEGAKISTLSETGKTGTWLVDPTDFTISAGSGASTSSGIGADTLAASLASTNVTLATDNTSGTDSGDINVNAAVSWSANTTLTLDAYNDINVNAAITATGASAGLVLNHGNYASTGSVAGGTDYNVNAPITLSGASATLSINGAAYTLLHSMAAIDAIDTTGLGGRYALAQDLDASGTTYAGALVSSGNVFTGTFAGLGHTIGNLTISAGSSSSSVGLFGYTGTGSVIRDIGLVDASVSGGTAVGGLVGSNSGSISNSYVSGTVAGTTFVGGLVGYNNYYGGSIAGSHAAGTVNGRYRVGGLAGLSDGSIADSHATAAVTATGDEVGGLVGQNGGSISGSYATGAVRGAAYVGGLVGLNYASISDSYASGAVQGADHVGGLVGWSDSSISSSYASGDVTGSNYVGGLVGLNFNSISDSYATGAAAGTYYVGGLVGQGGSGSSIGSSYATGAVTGFSVVGGLVGWGLSGSSISNSYWDSASTGQPGAVGSNSGTVSNVTDVTAGTRYNHGSYANLGTWSETASGSGVWVANDGGGNTWVMIEGSTRPFLYSEYSTSIRNLHQLQLMALDPTASYTLQAGIDAGETSGSNTSGMWSTAGFAPVGNASVAFTGSLAGDGHGISNLTISRAGSDYVGLFGYTGTGSAISDVALVDASVSGATDVGALVGYNSGSISNSSVTGTVTGVYFVGALVGENAAAISGSYAAAAVTGTAAVGGLAGVNLGSISGSYVTGSVTGSGDYVGGLVGGNDYGSITDSYATADVTGSGGYVGGLAGQNYFGSIGNSYASGAVSGAGSNVGGLVGYNDNGTVTASFWNTETSGQNSSDGGTGITTAQMQAAATFIDAGWDVATTGGSSSVWRIYDGYTAPLLRSFLSSVTVTTGAVTGKTYDGTVASGSTSYTVSDSSATLLGSGLTYASSSANAGSYDTAAGTLTFSGLYSGQQGYDISYGYTDTSLTIAKASLTVGTGNVSKTYDGTTAAAGTAIVAGGTLYGTDSLSGGTFTYDDKNAGTGKTVSVSGVSVNDGNSDGNYDVTYVANTASSITAATLTVSGMTAASKTYDGTSAATVSGGTLSGLVGGDSVSLSQSGTFSDKNAGTGKAVTATFALGGSDAGNYVLASNSTTTTADITAATLTVSGVTAASKTYDGTTAATVSGGTLTGLVGGDSVSLSQSGAFSDKNAGTGKAVTTTFALSGSDAANYVLASSTATTTADITAATLTVSGATAASKTYDGTTTATVSGGSLSGLVSGDSVSLSQSGTFSDKNAGTGKAVTATFALGGSDAGNYVLASSTATTTADITAATLTVSGATAASKTYDGTTTATVSGGSLSGLVGGDSVSLSQSGTFGDKNAGTGKAVTASFALSGSDAANYVLASSTATTTADITAATLTVSGATAASKTYDGTTTATVSGGSLSGLVSGDSVSLSQSGTFSDKNAGTGKAVTATFALSGSDAVNYVLASNSTMTTADITAATLTVSGATAASKTYDGTTAATVSGGSLSGLVSGDSVSLSQSGTFGDKNAGTGKAVTATFALGGSDAANYLLASSTATTTADITAATLTVSGATAASKTYDGTTMATVSGGSLSGLVSGDSVTLSQSGTFSDKNAGTGKAVTATFALSGSDAVNYVLASNSTMTTADITAATLTVSGATAASKTYDGTTAATVSGGSLSGLVSGDSVSLSQSGTFGDKNAGTGKAVTATFALSGSDAGNYVLASSTAATTADITAATLTVSGATAASKTYDGTTAATVSGGSLSGLVSGDSVSLNQSGTFGDKNAGTGKAVTATFALSGSDAANYVLASSTATTTADITPAALTVTANDDSRVADGTAYIGGNGVRYSGFVAGESSDVLGGSLLYGGSAQGAVDAGSYTLRASGLSASNYSLSYVDGTLVISPAAVTETPVGSQPTPTTTPLATSLVAQRQAVEQQGADRRPDDRNPPGGSMQLRIESCGIALDTRTGPCDPGR